MNQQLRDALLELLFRRMARHVQRGLSYDEALILGVEEIRRQIRETRPDIARKLVDTAVNDVRYARESGVHGMKLH